MQDNDDGKDFMIDQLADTLYNMIISNIKVYMKILEANKVDPIKIKTSYAEYLNKCKSSGISIPKSRSHTDMSRLPRALGNAFHKEEFNILDKNNMRKLPIDKSNVFLYKGLSYYATQEPYWEGQVLCCDETERIMLIWDYVNEKEIDLTKEDVEWLVSNNYRIHPMFLIR